MRTLFTDKGYVYLGTINGQLSYLGTINGQLSYLGIINGQLSYLGTINGQLSYGSLGEWGVNRRYSLVYCS